MFSSFDLQKIQKQLTGWNFKVKLFILKDGFICSTYVGPLKNAIES